jgi:NAD-dependent deacetylase
VITADALDHAADLLSRSRAVVAFTGAGISEESGLPTYRGEGGLWRRFDPYKVASIEEFRRDPTVYWTYSRTHRRLGANPNPAHLALVQLERSGRLRAVITQNTDGLHQKAGSSEVIELHGSSAAVVCLDCQARYPRAEIDALNAEQCPPHCPRCGARYLKPTVVFFGEPLPIPALARAQELAAKADLMLVVGSSLQVYPAAGIPRLARDAGASLVIINAEPTPFDSWARIVLHGKAGEILPQLLARVRES